MAAVKLRIKVAFAPNDPEISEASCAELLTKVLPNSLSAVLILEAKDELVDVNEPLMSDAIWAELLIKVLPSSLSAAVILEAKEELVDVNEPDISEAILAELLNRLFPNSPYYVVIIAANEELSAVEEPEISEAICAELLNRVLPNSDSAAVTLAANDELTASLTVTLAANDELSAVEEPEMSDAIWAELDTRVFPSRVPILLLKLIKEPDTDVHPGNFKSDPVIAKVEFRLPFISTLPVNLWKSSELSPNLVDPDSKIVDDETISVWNSWAVKVPPIVKSPDTFPDPVKNNVSFAKSYVKFDEPVTSALDPVAVLPDLIWIEKRGPLPTLTGNSVEPPDDWDLNKVRL